MTHSEENYIKGIYHLSEAGAGSVSTTTLATHMETKPSSVTDMIKRLAGKELVNYKKYQGVRLTEQGQLKALQIIRKHRLWETFLVEKLDFNWDEVHEVAEQLEHIKSDMLVDRLDALLDYPDYDPHGDPIPDKDGAFKTRDKKLLANLGPGKSGQCVGVVDSSAAYLKFLDKHGIALGDSITVLEREEFDQSLKIRIGTRNFSVSQRIASNLYVKPIEN
ncbi:iron (metal) dependent repressor, DtxR family [Robiginitalea myxolifaciens]|uniref:Transcriptional regulator MntR n=1 Tax=Robiginitalea myxolifaciens TaxID=400055 RepID=A0A1I6FYR1_9FLAO|nr:metal-dependent transcriptional regulator [Robiginitalea myxolifaciens]SFR35054.1 iron (metal) dependent repressor, DtxR family [Robiginitalea myxolifaciens]